MNNYEKIINLSKESNGYVSIKVIRANNINHKFLYDLVKKGDFEKVSKGLYILKDEFVDEYYKIHYASKYVVYSHATALYFYGLSDRVPLVIDITVPYFYNGSLQKNKNVNLKYVKREIWQLGINEIETPFGNKVKAYDVERTICDIIKNKDEVDIEIFTKALNRYVNLDEKDINKLIKYAKVLKIEDKVREYMEVLLK